MEKDEEIVVTKRLNKRLHLIIVITVKRFHRGANVNVSLLPIASCSSLDPCSFMFISCFVLLVVVSLFFSTCLFSFVPFLLLCFQSICLHADLVPVVSSGLGWLRLVRLG